MPTILLLNKPFNTLSQFRDEEGRKTLADYIPTKRYPKYYPAGRLDYDSEGLIVLTNHGPLQHRISHPKAKLAKTYWVQVEGEPTSDDLSKLSKGVVLKDGRTLPAKVKHIEKPQVWERTPPIRTRKSIPTTWLEIQIKEGKNRQVRRMTAAVGFPTLRLIRYAIGSWNVDSLAPGEFKEVSVHL